MQKLIEWDQSEKLGRMSSSKPGAKDEEKSIERWESFCEINILGSIYLIHIFQHSSIFRTLSHKRNITPGISPEYWEMTLPSCVLIPHLFSTSSVPVPLYYTEQVRNMYYTSTRLVRNRGELSLGNPKVFCKSSYAYGGMMGSFFLIDLYRLSSSFVWINFNHFYFLR